MANTQVTIPSNLSIENATTSAVQRKGIAQFEPVYTEIAKLISIAAAVVLINSVVLYLFARKNSLRTISNYPLFSLAVCDFFCGVFVIPLFVIVFFTPLIQSKSSKFYLGFLVTVLHNFVAILTVYHIVVVTAERYLAVKFPLKHRVLSQTYMRRVLAVVWICSFLVSLIPLAWINKIYPAYKPESSNFTLAFSVFFLAFALLLPYMFLIFAFTSMFRVVNRSFSKSFSKSASASPSRVEMRGERKCLVLFVTMAFVFLLCWLPWFTVFLLVQLPVKLEPSKLGIISQVAVIIKYMTSVINPLLYTFIKKDFCRALKYIFKKPEREPQVTTISVASFARQPSLQKDFSDSYKGEFQSGAVNTAISVSEL